MGVTASTMSLNVGRLEAAGYVQRERDPHNARQVQIRLTDAGNRLKQQQNVLDSQLVAKLLRQLNGDERQTALRGLKLLANAANEIIQKREPTPRRLARGKTKNPL